jgi:hypothetical protein
MIIFAGTVMIGSSIVKSVTNQINMNGFPACAFSVFWVHHRLTSHTFHI